MQTTLVIPVHNAPHHTEALLATIREEILAYSLVIVDDASSGDLPAYLAVYVQELQAEGGRAVYLRNERQQLFTRTVNRGWREAVARWNPETVTTLNTDIAVRSGWLEELLHWFDVEPTMGIVGYPDEPTGLDARGKPLSRPWQQLYYPDYVTGHCWTASVPMLRQIGVLSESDLDGRYSPELRPYLGQAHIGSERVLCNRAQAAGWKTFYSLKPLCRHGQGPSWGRRLDWLTSFKLEPLWEANDTLEEAVWKT